MQRPEDSTALDGAATASGDQPHPDPAVRAKIVAMRETGASWLEVQRAFSLTRQQARYAYQVGRREERRREKRER